MGDARKLCVKMSKISKLCMVYRSWLVSIRALWCVQSLLKAVTLRITEGKIPFYSRIACIMHTNHAACIVYSQLYNYLYLTTTAKNCTQKFNFVNLEKMFLFMPRSRTLSQFHTTALPFATSIFPEIFL